MTLQISTAVLRTQSMLIGIRILSAWFGQFCCDATGIVIIIFIYRRNNMKGEKPLARVII